MFDWLGDAIEWIGKFFPRLTVIRATHRGVKFVRGKKLKLVNAGLCVHWPLVTELDVLAVSRQTINLPTQRLVTKDGKRVITSAVVVYHIGDVMQAVGKSWDVDETINDVSMAAIAAIITRHEYEVLVKNLGSGLREQLTKACSTELRQYGIRVRKCLLTDFCPANVIALSNSDTVNAMGED